MPATSSSVRSRAKRCSLASGSHSRNRGQARVQLVHPFSPWVQLSAPSSSSRWKGLYSPAEWLYPMTSCGQLMTQPAQPVHRPDVMTSLYSSFHWYDQRSFLGGAVSAGVPASVIDM